MLCSASSFSRPFLERPFSVKKRFSLSQDSGATHIFKKVALSKKDAHFFTLVPFWVNALTTSGARLSGAAVKKFSHFYQQKSESLPFLGNEFFSAIKILLVSVKILRLYESRLEHKGRYRYTLKMTSFE